tara:strand:- start:105 stop:662 length:558 start_codon:yes stop_codon:yes gene_type:complete
MATKRIKTRKRSCKYSKLKKPIRTKKGGKRRCKKGKRKSRKKFRMMNIEDLPNEMLLNIFENSKFNDLVHLYYTNRRLKAIAIDIVNRDPNKNRKLRVYSKTNNIRSVRLLLDAGADPDSPNRGNGKSALMQASRRGNTEIVQLLLNAGADTDLQDNNGYTALMQASDSGHTEIVQLLLNAGATL